MSEQNERSEHIRRTVLNETQEVCRRAAKSFASSSAQLLVRGLEGAQRDECRSSLEMLFQSAGKLSTRLWTQRPALRCDYLQQLQQLPFSISSPVLQAHTLHRLDDPEDRSLDRKLVRIVVHPAVFGIGTHDADNYDKARIWTKAVVWLDV